MQQDRNVNSASIILCSLRQAGHTPQPATNTTNRKTRGQRISFSLGLKFCKHSPGPHRHRQQGGPRPGLAAANVSAKHTKSCHRSIPDRFLMSAGDRSKNCALCSRWEARLWGVTIRGMVGEWWFLLVLLFSQHFLQWLFRKGQILSLKAKH